MILRQALCLVSLACLAICPSAPNPSPNSQMAYDLYSWPNSDRGWNFCILPVSGAEKNVELVFDHKTMLRGIVMLKRKISTLPSGSEIHWLDRIPSGTGPKAKGSECLAYPPAVIVNQVKQYARKRQIKVEVLSSNPFGAPGD